MKYFIPLLAVFVIANFLPNNSMALAAYVIISLYSVYLTAGLFRKASPEVKRQVLIAASCAVLMALGFGAFLYFR